MDGPLLVIDRLDDRPVVTQIVEAMREAVLTGALRAGDRVPSTRRFAAELGVARSSVVSAYEQLAGEGFVELRQGAPTLVAQLGDERAVGHPPLAHVERPDAGPASAGTAPPSAASALLEAQPTVPRIDLRPGRPSTTRIDERAWRAAWRRAASLEIPSDEPPRFGEPELRAAIADHVRHARGFACDAEDVIVTAGTSEALRLVGQALGTLAGDRPRVAVEHPGYPSARLVLERTGAAIVPIEVGDDGLRVDLLRRMPQPPHAVMVTPSHQYPLGGRLPVAARLELLEHARRIGAIVIEDDYDSEFRHVGPPMPTLASLDGSGAVPGHDAGPGDAGGAVNRRVVLVGSFSKILTPWLRLGYAVLPHDDGFRTAMAEARAELASPVPGIVQVAVAHLLGNGTVRRHIAATRRDYAHRRGLVIEALGELPGAHLIGLDGGLHAVLRVADAAVVDAVVTRLDAAGVAVARLSEYSAARGDEQPGVVIGYAGVADHELAEGLARIRAAVLAAS